MHVIKIAFWTIFTLTLLLYAVMVLWSLPTISTAASGLAPFDMRPAGYAFVDAQEFLSALPPDAVDFYREVQLGMLDLLYPAMLGISLFLAIALLAPMQLGYWRWAVALIAVPGTVFDYLENNFIRFMLWLGPNNITPEIVSIANTRTVAKAMFTTVAMSVLLIMLLIWIWQKLQSRRRSPTG